MAKMNGNQGHGKAATNIWQVMNYQVPRGYVCAPLSPCFFCLTPLLGLLFLEGHLFVAFFSLGTWTDEGLGFRKCVHKVILHLVRLF